MDDDEALEGAVDSAAAAEGAPAVDALDTDEAVLVAAMPPVPDVEDDYDDS